MLISLLDLPSTSRYMDLKRRTALVLIKDMEFISGMTGQLLCTRLEAAALTLLPSLLPSLLFMLMVIPTVLDSFAGTCGVTNTFGDFDCYGRYISFPWCHGVCVVGGKTKRYSRITRACDGCPLPILSPFGGSGDAFP